MDEENPVAEFDTVLPPTMLEDRILTIGYLFVFEPVNRKLISQEDMAPRFGHMVWQRGLRVLIPGPTQYMHVLF